MNEFVAALESIAIAISFHNAADSAEAKIVNKKVVLLYIYLSFCWAAV
jgi:hypothetical protein